MEKWLFLYWNASPAAGTHLGKLRFSLCLVQLAVPFESPAHNAQFHSWYQQTSRGHPGKMNPGWGRTHRSGLLHPKTPLVPDSSPPSPISRGEHQGMEMRDHTRDHQHVVTPGKYKTVPKQYFTWGHESNVCVLLFDITRLGTSRGGYYVSISLISLCSPRCTFENYLIGKPALNRQ